MRATAALNAEQAQHLFLFSHLDHLDGRDLTFPAIKRATRAVFDLV